jgi:hypothetical protein
LRLNPGLLDKIPESARAEVRRNVAELTAAMVPPIAVAVSICVTTFVLWAGAKSVAKSGRLPRPWPVLADLAVPREAMIGLGIALPLSLLDAYPGLAARTFCVAFITAFGLQGVAIVHKLTLGMNGRFGLLFVLYALLPVSVGLLVPVLALAGVADHFLDIRNRSTRRGPPPPFLPPTDPQDPRRNPWK